LPTVTFGAMTVGMTATQPVSALVPRLLVFFARGTEPGDVQSGLAEVEGATEKVVDLIDSLTWYESRFAACGNWDSWAVEAVTGRSYRHRRAYFDGFVHVGSEHVGQGTAKTLTLALSFGKPVYWLSEGTLKPVAEVPLVGDRWHIQAVGGIR
jgi:hypothetical protein